MNPDEADDPLKLETIEYVAIELGRGSDRDSITSQIARLLFWVAESYGKVPEEVLHTAFLVAVEYVALMVERDD